MRASRAICQRRVPKTKAVVRLRSACESCDIPGECKRSSLCAVFVATRCKISKAAERAGVMLASGFWVDFAGRRCGGLPGLRGSVKTLTRLKLKVPHEVHAFKFRLSFELHFVEREQGSPSSSD